MRYFLISIILFYLPAALASLTPPEMTLSQYVVTQQPSQLRLLKKIVNVNSGTNNIKGVYRVGRIVKKELQHLGFTCKWINEPHKLHKAGMLIAERHSQFGKHILLIAHLDTVFPPQSHFRHFVHRKQSVYGPGVTDNKGGIMVLLYAIRALHATHGLSNTNITVVLMGDEEATGKPSSLSRKPLIDLAHKQDIALDFEPSITLDTATIARRGISEWVLKTYGQEAHSASIFTANIGDGAIFELAQILNTMRMQLKDEKYLTFNPGIIFGGTTINDDAKNARGIAFGKTNVVAQIAMAKGDLRFIDNDQKIASENKIEAIVKNALPGTHAEIQFQDGTPAMVATENNLHLLEKYSEVSKDLNLGTVTAIDPIHRGAADISYIANIVPANLSGLGPMGNDIHTEKESLDITSLTTQTERAAILLYRLSHEKN